MEEIRLLNNRYQLLERHGKGGMAIVYRARDTMLERDVAIKVLRDSYSRDPAFLERFRQEAKAAANLSHPNIVTVHDFGLDNGQTLYRHGIYPGHGSENAHQAARPVYPRRGCAIAHPGLCRHRLCTPRRFGAL